MNTANSIFYGTDDGIPFRGLFGIFIDYDTPVQTAVIVLCGQCLLNSDHGRDDALNAILDQHLRGVRTQFIRFVVVVGHDTNEPFGKEFRVEPDWKDCAKKGLPIKREGLRRRKTINSIHLVAGACRYCTDFEDGRHLSLAETKKILKKATIVG